MDYKYKYAITIIADALKEVGAELYTIELIKQEKDGERMVALMDAFAGNKNTREQFDELIEVIKILKEYTNDN